MKKYNQNLKISPQHNDTKLREENKSLIKENGELRVIFNTAIDNFNILKDRIFSLEKENVASINYIKELELENQNLKSKLGKQIAKVKKFASMIFGKKSETLVNVKIDNKGLLTAEFIDNKSSDDTKSKNKSKAETSKKKKGGQPGHKGNGRKIPDNLPIKETIIVLPEDEEFYGISASEWIPCEGLYEEAFMITKETVWTKIRFLRQKYKKPENSDTNIPTIITAPVPPKLINKGKYTTDVWVDLINEKYQKHVPIERQVFDAQQAGVDLHQSTVFGGFKTLYEKYFQPLNQELIFEMQKDKYWHADETRWHMLCDITKKLWYMWGFKTKKITVFVLDATRCASVPAKIILGIDDIYDIKEPVQIPIENKIILNVDRYSAYKMLERLGFLILSFCWAHQRRDFTDMIKKYPKNIEIVEWAEKWLKQIAKLYKINNNRIKHPKNSEIFLEYDTQLREIVDKIYIEIQNEIQAGNKKKKELKKNEMLDETSDVKLAAMISINNHWEGLTIFVDKSVIPMDNNLMENSMRPIALGRNNYIGSQSLWGGDYAACMYSLVQTCKQNNISFKAYSKYFLDRCMNENINNEHPELMNSLLPFKLSEQVIAAHDLKLKKY